MDHPDFDPYEVDADGLPLVYNEERIAGFWKGKPSTIGLFTIQCNVGLWLTVRWPHLVLTLVLIWFTGNQCVICSQAAHAYTHASAHVAGVSSQTIDGSCICVQT